MTLVVLLVLAARPVATDEAPASETQEIQLSSESGLFSSTKHQSTVIGNASLVSSTAAINADRITYDHNEHAATAVGNVVARLFDSSGNLVVTADVLSVRFDGEQVEELFLLEGEVVSKKQVTKQQLLAATTAETAKKAGVTALLLKGNHLRRVDDDTWHADTLDLVPCECNFDKPSWKIKSSSANIDTQNDRASMWNTSIWLYDTVPVMWLPWISLPLSERQTGLLFPKPNLTFLNGFSLEWPVFITLGRSYDLTLTPGYFFGAPPASNGADPPQFREPVDGIQGPRLQGEFRYAPTHRITGKVNLGVFYDFKRQRDPVNPFLYIDAPRGVRGEGSWLHVQDFGSGFGARVEGYLQSDGKIQGDLVTDVIARQAGYLRSAASVFHRTANSLVVLDVVLRQDLVYGYNVFGTTPRALGSPAPVLGPNPIQRLPGVSFTLPLRQLIGPLSFDVHAEVVRHAPVSGQTGDEGSLANEGRLANPASPGEDQLSECARERMYYTPSPTAACKAGAKIGVGDGVWQLGEREARDRLTLFPRLVAAWQPGRVVSLTTWAGYRQAFYVGELSGRTSQRGYALLSARAETELGRTFADGSLRHSLTPIAELRAVPFVSQTASSGGYGSPAPYDEIDLAIPAIAGARVQAITELRQRLVNRAGREFLRLEVGQGYNLIAPEAGVTGLGETYGRVSASAWLLGATVSARYDPVLNRATRIAGSWSFDDGRGDAIGMGYENVLDDGTSRSRQPVDLLFGNRVPLTAQSRAQLVSAGARAKLGPLTLKLDILFTERIWGTIPMPIGPQLTFAYYTLGAGFAPACDCWRLEAGLTQRLQPLSGTLTTNGPVTTQGFLGGPEFSVTFTASRFGSFGTVN